MTGEVETYYEDGSWRNWSDGDDIGRPHESRQDAVAEGRRVAADRRAEHIVRDERATIVERAERA